MKLRDWFMVFVHSLPILIFIFSFMFCAHSCFESMQKNKIHDRNMQVIQELNKKNER